MGKVREQWVVCVQEQNPYSYVGEQYLYTVGSVCTRTVPVQLVVYVREQYLCRYCIHIARNQYLYSEFICTGTVPVQWVVNVREQYLYSG